jgi:hypothetical protein
LARIVSDTGQCTPDGGRVAATQIRSYFRSGNLYAALRLQLRLEWTFCRAHAQRHPDDLRYLCRMLEKEEVPAWEESARDRLLRMHRPGEQVARSHFRIVKSAEYCYRNRQRCARASALARSDPPALGKNDTGRVGAAPDRHHTGFEMNSLPVVDLPTRSVIN